MNIDEMRDAHGQLPAFAWPGGYAISYVCADGGELCADCANGKNLSEASTAPNTPDDWRLVGYVAYGATADYPSAEDGPVVCSYCRATIAEPVEDSNNV